MSAKIISIGSRYPLKGEKVNHSDVLCEKTEKRASRNFIYFCSSEGFIHSSYCGVCPMYLGDMSTARFPPEKRNPSACRNREAFVGEVEGQQLYFKSQTEFDNELKSFLNIDNGFAVNGFKVPVPAHLIKARSNPNVVAYDQLRANKEFCRRCGQGQGGRIGLACWEGCGSKALCENCAVDLTSRRNENDEVLIDFKCPVCSQPTLNLNLGKSGEHATILTQGNHSQFSKNLGLPAYAFFPINYENMVDSFMTAEQFGDRFKAKKHSVEITKLMNEMSIDMPLFFKQAPGLVQPKMGYIGEGLMKGIYLYSTEEKLAFSFRENAEYLKPLDKLSFPDGIADLFDVTISYAYEDIVVARNIVNALKAKGIKARMIDIDTNQGDSIWAIRYREMLYASGCLLPLLSPAYIERAGSAFELYEMFKIDSAFNFEERNPFSPVLPILHNNVNLSRLRERANSWVRSHSEIWRDYHDRSYVFNPEAMNIDSLQLFLNLDNWGVERLAFFVESMFFGDRLKRRYGEYIPMIENKVLGYIHNYLNGAAAVVYESLTNTNQAHVLLLEGPKAYCWHRTISKAELEGFGFTPTQL